MTNTTNAASVAEEQAFEAWFKQDCPVSGINAKLGAKSAWIARAALAAHLPTRSRFIHRRTQMTNTPMTECWSANNEDFSHESLGDLLDSHDDLRPGDVVYRAEAHMPKVSHLVYADDVIEQIGDRAYDIGGEYAEDYPECTKEQAAELQTLLEQWLSECPPPRFFSVKNVQPYTLTEGDFL